MASSFESFDSIVQANIHIAHNLYEKLSRKEENLFFSPFGVYTILCFAFQGATGRTAECLKKALNLADPETAANEYKLLTEKINSNSTVSLYIANKMYVHEPYKLEANFQSIARANFASEVDLINFTQNEEAAKRINSWVGKRSNKKIKDIISPDVLDVDTRVLLVNALYFKGGWMKKFPSSSTNKTQFYMSETQFVLADMMHIDEQFMYDENQELDAQVIAMPFDNPEIQLMIFLSRSKTGIEALEKKIFKANLIKIHDKLVNTGVSLSLPKFKMEQTTDLKDPLSGIGLGDLFNGTDLTKICSEPMGVSTVIQKAFFEIHEDGTDHLFPYKRSSFFARKTVEQKAVFCADHPFILILIYTCSEGLFPLFIGKLLNPT